MKKIITLQSLVLLELNALIDNIVASLPRTCTIAVKTVNRQLIILDQLPVVFQCLINGIKKKDERKLIKFISDDSYNPCDQPL